MFPGNESEQWEFFDFRCSLVNPSQLYPQLHCTHSLNCRSQSHIATDGQSVSQSVSLGVEPHLGLMPRYLLLFDSYGLVFCGALSDERTGLSFVYAAGHRQRSLSRVRVPKDLWPYFTVSDLRLPFSSPPTTRIKDNNMRETKMYTW
jgi:hypothetical protein